MKMFSAKTSVVYLIYILCYVKSVSLVNPKVKKNQEETGINRAFPSDSHTFSRRVKSPTAG